MKMNVSRIQAIMSHEDPRTEMNLSMQVARGLSQALQACGIRSISLSTVNTVGGREMRPSDVSFFDDAPYEIQRVAAPASDALAHMMCAFGVSSMSLECDTSDMDSLRRSWSFIVNDESQLDAARRAEDGRLEGIRDYGVGEEPGDPGTDEGSTLDLKALAASEVKPRSRVRMPGLPFGEPVPRPGRAKTPTESSSATQPEIVEI